MNFSYLSEEMTIISTYFKMHFLACDGKMQFISLY